MSADVDLRPLAVRREEPAAGPSRRHLLTRYGVPGALVAGFLALVGWAGRDRLVPAKPVTVVPVLAMRGEAHAEGAPLFQAAGWVEPRPTPVVVTALAEGVVEQVLVVEGQEVKAGEPVARLIDVDSRLALQAAEADLRLRTAERAAAAAAVEAARTNAAQPVALRAAVAEADALLAQRERELGTHPHELKAARARQRLAQLDWEGKSRAAGSGSVPEASLNRARSERDAADAAVAALIEREPRLRREVEALERRRDALCVRLELKTEEVRQLAEAEANLQAAGARLEQARVAADAARLRLDRMVVRAPVAGRVLALMARPGMRLMGLSPGSLHESSTVALLYEPTRLQVRADVPLGEVARVRPGQAARVESSALPAGPLEGEVLFATSQADVQKNTLQVKVAVKSPPPLLKPDMLVQVTFLAPAASGTPAEGDSLRLLVPRSLVEAGEGGGRVWVADQAAGRAVLRTVQLGAASGELVEVREGLNASDKLIASGREGLRDGRKITVTGEEGGTAWRSSKSAR